MINQLKKIQLPDNASTAYLKFCLRFIGVALLFFLFQRFLFIIYYFSDLKEAGFSSVFYIPFKALRLDLSTASYMLALPFVLGLPVFFFKNEKWLKWYNIFILILICFIFFVISLIHAGELMVYQEWKTKLSSRIFLHFETPDEVGRTASNTYTILFIFFVFLQALFFYFVYFKWLKKNKLKIYNDNLLWKFIHFFSTLLTGIGIIIILLRGGVGQIPISLKSSYFSNKHILNDLCINSTWHFMHDWYLYIKFNIDEYFDVIPQEQVDEQMAILMKSDPSQHIDVLEKKNCNLIFIVLEGWSAQMIEPMGGYKNVSPNFNQAAKEGVLFRNVYATSWTSEVGHASIFSCYPAIPKIKITQLPQKIRNMPSLTNILDEYYSHHHFGGDFSYGNIGGYLLDAGFDEITDENQMTELEPKGKLGIHDEATFPFFLNRVKNAKQPFIYGLFTQSTHAPFDFPGNEDQHLKEHDAYQQAITYADNEIGKFLKAIKNSPLYENTLVVLVSDHGRINNENENPYSEKMFHVPVLFWGGPLKDSAMGMQVDKLGSQIDVVKTLLMQMGKETKGFKWSKDLLNPSSAEFALHTCINGYGWVDKNGHFAYNMADDIILENSYKSDEEYQKALNQCRCYITSAYREFKKL